MCLWFLRSSHYGEIPLPTLIQESLWRLELEERFSTAWIARLMSRRVVVCLVLETVNIGAKLGCCYNNGLTIISP